MWADRWLAEYTTNLIKRQWGENLSKFKDTPLFNGMQFDADAIRTEADANVRRLEDEIVDKYSFPPLGEIA